MSVLDLAANQHLRRESIGLFVIYSQVNLSFDLTFSPDGHLLYVVSLGSGDVSVIDLRTQHPLAHVDAGDGPRGIVISPDGRKAYGHNALADNVFGP